MKRVLVTAGPNLRETIKNTLKEATAGQSHMRQFVLLRTEDATGTSGTGVVAEGMEFSNGQCAVHWLSQLETVTIYANIRVVERLHGHDGRTTIRWTGVPHVD